MDNKLVSFMDSLSPEQRTLFTQLSMAAGVAQTPDGVTDMMEEEVSPNAPFYNLKPSVASKAEVLVLSALLTASKSRSDLDAWLLEAETDLPRMQKLGDEWAPMPHSIVWNSQGNILLSLEASLRQYIMADGGSGVIETVTKVTTAWHASGSTTPAAIDGYLKALRRPCKPKDRRLQGPKRDGGRTSSARHVSAIPAIVTYLRQHRQLLRSALHLHRVEADGQRSMTKAELVDAMEEEREEYAATVLALEVEHAHIVAEHGVALAAKQARVDTARKAASKAQAGQRTAKEITKGTAKRVREEERAKLPALSDARVAQVDALRRKAHAEKREYLERADKAEHLAATRLVLNSKLKQKHAALRVAHDHLVLEMEDMEEGELHESYLEAWARQQAMPTWAKTRGKGSGRGQAGFDFDFRVTIYSMVANGTPLSAIGPNITAVVRRTASWLKPEPPSPRVLTESRFELRFIEEALSARRVASAYAIRMMGFDETTKNGNPSITSNVIVEPTKGAPLEPVIMRGAYCSAGGTSELVAKAIESKCFERLRGFLRRWKAKFLVLYPEDKWTGPEPEQLSMARLAGGGALQSDTCNTAEKAKTILAEMIAEQAKAKLGADAWAAMSEQEQQEATRVNKLDCYQHLRNIFLKEMSSAQSKHVAEELKPHLDAFSSWERMTTDYTQLLRAAYKEFHHGNKYYKGKGREFWVWLKEQHPTAFACHFERAEGGRQDLDYDAAVPLYIMRPYIVEYLHGVVFGADHSNILEDFLYATFRSEEFISMTRANATIDLLISRPLRWLAGNSYKLDKWSPVSMTRVLDIVEQLFVKASTDGAVIIDPTLNVFKEIADEQPLFAKYLKDLFEEYKVLAADGKTEHLAYKLARAELLSPQDPTNASPNVRAKTIECAATRPPAAAWSAAVRLPACTPCRRRCDRHLLAIPRRYLEVQCVAGLRKLHDPKLALANKLESQGGTQSFAKSAQAHADTVGLDATNDRLAESVFGVYDYVLRRCPGISMEAASAVAQAMRAKSFVEGGYFYLLPPREQHALVEVARTTVRELRALDRADHAEHDTYVTQKRKSNSQLELDALVKRYALALSFFDRWRKRGVADVAAMTTALNALANDQLKLNYLREQIEMRVIGLGFVDFTPKWSSSKDAEIGTVSDLTTLLRDILMEEEERRVCDELPQVAVVPIMKRKTFKELGTPTAQAEALSPIIKELSPEELLAQAQEQRAALEAAGEIDRVGDLQPDKPPPLDDSIIGTQLEICWRYWRSPTEEEIAKGEKRKKIGVPIWCEGKVVLVANGTTTTERPESAKCKKLAKAGAVRIHWPADKERDEPDAFSWYIFQNELWAPPKDTHMAWRFSEAELRKRADAADAATEAAEAACAARKRRK